MKILPANARWPALGWLLAVMLVVLLAWRQGPAFDSSILSLLPASEQDPLAQRASAQLGRDFSERLLVVVSGTDDGALRAAVAALADALQSLPAVESVEWRLDEAELAGLRNELFPYRFVVLDAGLRARLLDGDRARVREAALARLFGPLAGGDSLLEDPFGLFFEYGLGREPDLKLRVSGSLLALSDSETPAYLLLLKLAQDPFSPALQASVLGELERQRIRLAPALEDIELSGMLVHAAAGARQAQGEISTIGVGSLIGIVVVMLLVFRRARPLLLLLLPIAVGCLFASAASLLVFERVHLVTFAFGAGLVGVSVDYALHYLAERQVSAPAAVLPRILPGLLLGLLSSVAAYAAQAMTPFPGLRQMALFSVFGLVSAWLTVVLWFPLLAGNAPLQPLGAARRLAHWRSRFARLDRSRWLAGVLLLVLVLAAITVWRGEARDDIRLLQTSPQQLLDQERELHRKLGSSGGARFLLVSGNSLQACLRLEERLRPALRALQAQGLIEGFRMLSSSLPSLARQAENAALVAQLYRRELAPMFARIGLPQARLRAAQDAFEQAASARLTPAAWQQFAASAAQRNLLIANDASAAATAIRFSGELSPRALQRLAELAEATPGVRLVDRVAALSSLLGKYRVQVAGWVLSAYLALLLVLYLRYRRELWRIVLAPLAASIITLAILVELQGGINLFHLMALILVLGIGLDMGIFMAENDESAHTWLAVSLSAATSLLAFGLLAASATPVLHHFGLTVALGLTLVWLLAPTMRKR